jgi:LPXTG-motif cell wall-anchored protein
MRIKSKIGVGASITMLLAIPFGNAAQASTLTVPVPPKNVNHKLTTVAHPKSNAISVSIPAGAYDVTQGSFDDAHPNQEEQLNERWYAVFYSDAGDPVATTATTPDLLLADVNKSWSTSTIVLTANAVSVVYFHAPGGEGPDSIYPDLLTLAPVVQYPPAPPKHRDGAGSAGSGSSGGSREKGTTTTTTPAVPEQPARSEAAPVPGDPAPIPIAVEPAVRATPEMVGPVKEPSPPASIPRPSSPTTTTTTTTTTRLGVEVKGIQLENTVAPAFETTEVAFTGSESSLMALIAAGLITVGAFALVVARKRRLQ